MKHFARQRSSTLVATLVMCVVAACGGKSSTDDNVESSTGGSGDGDGDGMGANTGDGDGDSPRGSGGSGGTGGFTSETGGQDPGTGGDMPTGGSPGQVLVTLGDDCSSPGSFACAANNPKLALICGGDGEWESRETCSGDALCDFNAGSNEGTCRVPLAECTEEGMLVCEGKDVYQCNDGGFETTMVEACGEGEGCVDAECIWVADECAEDSSEQMLFNCSGDECAGWTDAACFACGWSGAMQEDGTSIVRLPTTACSTETCGRSYYLAVITAFDNSPDKPLRVSVGAGWGLIPYEEGNWNVCESTVEGCVIVPPRTMDNDRGAILIPLSENTVTRNLVMEVVEPGTTCD